MAEYIRGFIAIVRYLLPILSVLLVTFCGLGLLSKKGRRYKKVLLLDDMSEQSVNDGELLVGSGDTCDIVIDGINDEHCVISVCGKSFTVRPIGKSKIGVNKHSVRVETAFAPDDVISVGDREFSLRIKNNRKKDKERTNLYRASILCCLTLIQLLVMLSLIFAFPEKTAAIGGVFLGVAAFEWVYFIITKFKGAFIEVPVMFLITLGLSVVAHKGNDVILKQTICIAAGLIGAIVLSYVLCSAKRAISLRFIAFTAGVALFGVNMVFGVIYNGAQNWLNIAGFSFQPSELIKVIFVFICGTSVEKISNIKDSLMFIAFAVFCLGSLAYLSDFGTALIYAVVLFTVVSIRFCNIKLIGALFGAALLLGGAVILFFPYVAKRIFSFGQAFANAADSGYQQTRAMIATASGGLFGVGGGRGTLIKVHAADTDIVFGLISEEWGLIVSLCVLSCFVIFTLYAIKVLTTSKSAYYGITACAAAVLLLIQTALNVFGSLDMLPFTGVTLPFISNGGSSVIACLMLTAFLRAPLALEHSVLKVKGELKSEKN
ncbi:MAG: FtsW/RodA/SpoVE family cell cycle protein [Clostridia bacterium]|nr:FtsW/RodA/SpoVE family cell cycle protein [Clostridia bacterium]